MVYRTQSRFHKTKFGHLKEPINPDNGSNV